MGRRWGEGQESEPKSVRLAPHLSRAGAGLSIKVQDFESPKSYRQVCPDDEGDEGFVGVMANSAQVNDSADTFKAAIASGQFFF